MTLIEAGGLASGLIAIITLLSKLIHLISEIQKLILRLDLIQNEIDMHKDSQRNQQVQLDKHNKRILTLELTLETIADHVQEIKQHIKEMTNHVIK